jgi:hypothetical protein
MLCAFCTRAKEILRTGRARKILAGKVREGETEKRQRQRQRRSRRRSSKLKENPSFNALPPFK